MTSKESIASPELTRMDRMLGWSKRAVGSAFVLCVFCCAAPLLVGLGIGGASLASFAAGAEELAFVLLVLALVAYAVLRYRRAQVAACRVPAPPPVSKA